MTRSRDIVERLVQQTVRNVLFRESSPSRIQEAVAESVVTAIGSSTNNIPTEVRPGSLLHELVRLSEKGTDNPAEEDDEDNNADKARHGLWITDCMSWPIERLKAEKAELKRYLNRQRRITCLKTPEPSTRASIIHETYAILKLFLLERDPDYRQCLQQAMGGNNSFLTSLHMLLTLYATYFERAHGKQVR